MEFCVPEGAAEEGLWEREGAEGGGGGERERDERRWKTGRRKRGWVG